MNIEVLCHSSVKIESKGIKIYSDPFKIKEYLKDADVILITHSHYDHFSPEDIIKKENVVVVSPNNTYNILDILICTIPAYNTNKKFHLKENDWVGYILELENKKIYIAGDTDITEENKNIKCDIALVPVGGTYTMTYFEAAELINTIKPEKAIPIHYGDIVGKKEDAINFKENVNNSIKVEIQI